MAHNDVDVESPSSPLNGLKRKRTTRACDRCHRNASRCSPGIEGVACTRCEDQGARCTYNRPVKRRGPRTRLSRETAQNKASAAVFPTAAADADETMVPSQASIGSQTPAAVIGNDEVAGPATSQPAHLYALVETVLTPDVIQSLVEVFYRSIYPIRPYFHWPTFSAQIRQQMYRSDLGLLATTMAVCGLTAGRQYKGVSVPLELNPIKSSGHQVSSKCYDTAVCAIPSDLSQVTDYFQAMKASTVLASICLQNNDLKKAVVHLGHYTTLSTMYGFHNEANWPVDLTECERQERRRLYWGVYQQEQYIATNFGVSARQRESQAAVVYPAEVFDDKDITATSIRIRPGQVSFIQALNFCSDVYRLSENADIVLRTKLPPTPPSEPRGLVHLFLSRVYNSHHYLAESSHLVKKLHAGLPDELRSIKTNTGDPYLDRFGIVSSNILLTTYNLKMRLAGTDKASVHVCCAVASELLDEMGAVSAGFFQTASTNSLYHLAHVGHVLGSVIQPPISAWTCSFQNVYKIFKKADKLK